MRYLRSFLVWCRFLFHSPLPQSKIRQLYNALCKIDIDETIELPIGSLNACGLTVHFINTYGYGFALHEELRDGRHVMYAQELEKNGNITKGERVYLQGAYVLSFEWVRQLELLYRYIQQNGIKQHESKI